MPFSKSSSSSNPAALIQMEVVMAMGPRRPQLERGLSSPLLGKQVEALCSSCLSPPGALSNGICKLPYGFFHLSSLLWAALNPGLKFFKRHYNVSTWAGSDIFRLIMRKKVGPPRARPGSVETSAPCVLQEVARWPQQPQTLVVDDPEFLDGNLLAGGSAAPRLELTWG